MPSIQDKSIQADWKSDKHPTIVSRLMHNSFNDLLKILPPMEPCVLLRHTVGLAKLTCPKIAPQVHVASYNSNTASARLSERPRAPRPRPFEQSCLKTYTKAVTKTRTCAGCTQNVDGINVELYTCILIIRTMILCTRANSTEKTNSCLVS